MNRNIQAHNISFFGERNNSGATFTKTLNCYTIILIFVQINTFTSLFILLNPELSFGKTWIYVKYFIYFPSKLKSLLNFINLKIVWVWFMKKVFIWNLYFFYSFFVRKSSVKIKELDMVKPMNTKYIRYVFAEVLSTKFFSLSINWCETQTCRI